MQLNSLQRTNKSAKKVRVGRGGKRGKTSGRGHKGQKARAGHSIRPEIRDEIKKLPKIRGYHFNSIQTKAMVVNVATLEDIFDDGATISASVLLEKGLVRRIKGRTPAVKILGNGDVKKKFTIEGCSVSGVAKSKIEKAGGSIK